MRLPLGFAISAAFVLGVALHASGLFLPVSAFFVGAMILAWLWTEDWRVPALGSLLLVAGILGVVRIHGDDSNLTAPSELVAASSFSGVASEVPIEYPTAIYVRIDIEQPAPSRVFAQLPPIPSVAEADSLDLEARFVPNERTSFRGFSARRDTSGLLIVDQVVITGNEASLLQSTRTRVADEVSSRLRERVPEPAGAFATGVILGDDGAMTEATRDAFRVGGLTHMTAVSGVHVGIIAAAILLVSRLGLVSRWWMLGLSVPFIWSFAYLVGMRPSVVRASIMLTLLILANFLGRPRDTLNAVGIAAAAMLAVDPSFLYDIGFQLSVAATTGIALGVMLIGHRSHWHLVWIVPLSAQLATEPLVLYHFGYYSLVSPFANVLATPFLAITMAMSIITVLVSFLSSTVADMFAIATWAPAYAVVLIADLSASIPYLSDDVRPLSLSGVWSAYAVLSGLVALLFIVTEREQGERDEEYSLLYRV